MLLTEDIKLGPKIVTKLLKVVDKGLADGVGVHIPGQMCVEAAVCYALGLPHGDQPNCVDEAVRYFKIALNDCEWKSKAARARGMRKLAVAQLGSRDQIYPVLFADLITINTTRIILPKIVPLLLVGPEVKEIVRECKAVRTMKDALMAAGSAYSFFHEAIGVIDEVEDFAAALLALEQFPGLSRPHLRVEHIVHKLDDMDKAFDRKVYDELLLDMADIGLQALKRCKSPGCKYLYLCD